MGRRLFASILAGAAWALSPAAALAQESRALDAADQAGGTVIVTAVGVLALLAVAGVGYLYLRATGLEWDFQRKELPPEPGSGGHHES